MKFYLAFVGVVGLSMCLLPEPLRADPFRPMILHPVLPAFNSPGTTTVTLEGETAPQSQNFIYSVGTSTDSNPYTYLNFKGTGDTQYSYSLPMTLQWDTPTQIVAGSTVELDPYMTMTGVPLLETRQAIDYSTEFHLGFGVDALFVDFEINASFNLPNLSVSYGVLDAHGTTSDLYALGNTACSAAEAISGFCVMTGLAAPVDAWDVGIDLIALGANLPYAGPAFEVADAAGFDLALEQGMMITRSDILILDSYSFSGLAINAPSDLGNYHYTVTGDVNYSMSVASSYFYVGDLSLVFDGPFFDEQTIFQWQEGDGAIYAGTQYSRINMSQGISYTGQVDVVDSYGSCPSGMVNCFWSAANLKVLGEVTDPFNQLIPYTPPAVTPTQVTYEPVPEPSSLLLLGTGLVGMITTARRRLRQ